MPTSVSGNQTNLIKEKKERKNEKKEKERR